MGNFPKGAKVRSYRVEEIAALTGKSVQSIRAFCKRNNVERVGRRYLISDETLSDIALYYNIEPSEVSEFRKRIELDRARFEKEEESTQNQDLTDVLQQQIEFLKRELEQVREEKDRQIEDLIEERNRVTTLNENLTVMNNKLLQIAAEQKTRLLVDSQKVHEAEIIIQEKEEKTKQSWFRRHFG